MKLIELMEVVNENKTLKIFDYQSYYLLSMYDGKNAIDEKYNSWQIIKIEPFNDELIVYIDEF